MSAELRAITVADFDPAASLTGALLALNNHHQVELSPLTLDGLRRLVAEAFAAARAGEADALLIAFDQDADYDGANFIWFRDRYPRFVYVDRIVVLSGARGRGLARRLYERLFDQAREAGHDRIACEVNLRPPNPGSDAFHAALGFADVGIGAVSGSDKTVRYLMRTLAADG